VRVAPAAEEAADPGATEGVELVGVAVPAGQLGGVQLGDLDVHLGVHATMERD
jgi:hypothetical protein